MEPTLYADRGTQETAMDGMRKYTADDIMELSPCYDIDLIGELWGGRKSLSLSEICKLNISVEDIIWAVTKLMPGRDARLFACDCAEHVLWIYERDYPGDNRPRVCIEVTRSYTRDAAWSARDARDAARDARDAASAARDAASAAARDAASAAARDAASAAARDAASAAEKQWQLNCLIGYITEQS